MAFSGQEKKDFSYGLWRGISSLMTNVFLRTRNKEETYGLVSKAAAKSHVIKRNVNVSSPFEKDGILLSCNRVKAKVIYDGLIKKLTKSEKDIFIRGLMTDLNLSTLIRPFTQEGRDCVDDYIPTRILSKVSHSRMS